MLGEYLPSVNCEKMYLPKDFFKEPNKSKEKEKSSDDIHMGPMRNVGLNSGDNIINIHLN